MNDPQEPRREVDLVELPIEGVAAYWLSLRKLLAAKRSAKALAEEAEHVSEPYIKFLLESVFSMTPERAAEAALVRQQTELSRIARRFGLMRVALMDLATGENPRKTLVKMGARFSLPPIQEEEGFRLARDLIAIAEDNAGEKALYFNVNHDVKDEHLIVTLLFYVMYGRHQGKLACQPFLEFVRSSFFREGLSLVIDGFDAPFLRKRLKVHEQTILAECERKMELSRRLCLGIRDKLSYEELFGLARAWWG